MLQDPPILTIKRAWTRPDPKLVAKLAGAQTGHLVDAMNGRGAMDYRVKPVDPKNAHFCGVALTCQPGPDDNLAIVAALVLAVKGDVIVAAGEGFERSAVIGDNVCMMAKNAGCAALVTDTMARDLDGIVEAGLPMFARGITPNSCVKTGPGKIGLPIVCGGVAVQPGDVVVGDRDGVVVVPQAELKTVVAALGEIRKAEAAVQIKIRAGMKHMDSIAALLKSDKVQYLD
jgi:4-hydroxy-4-methyl-2-oxoglutarate aldolase